MPALKPQLAAPSSSYGTKDGSDRLFKVAYAWYQWAMVGRTPQWPPRSFVGRLPEPVRKELLRLGGLREYGSGRRIVMQGDSSRHVVVLLAGYVKVTTTSSGIQETLLAIRGPGDVVGELAAVGGTNRSANVTTCGRVSSRLIPHGIFERFLADRSAASRHLIAAIGDKLASADRIRAEFATLPAQARVASVLCELSDVFSTRTEVRDPIEIMVTQPELASMAGIREVTVQKELRKLREAGAIVTGYGRINVVDLAKLRDLTELEEEEPDRQRTPLNYKPADREDPGHGLPAPAPRS